MAARSAFSTIQNAVRLSGLAFRLAQKHDEQKRCMTGKINLKVLIIDRDFYALESLNSYLGWDRRTRVIALTSSVDEANTYLARLAEAELPDVILLDAEISADVTSLRVAIDHFRKLIKH